MAENLADNIAQSIALRMDRASKPVPLGISNRHLHMSKEDFKALFGPSAELSELKPLRQPGQFACKEVVDIEGPKGKIEKVRILGPFRSKTQVELSCGDAIRLGVMPPVRDSGKLDSTPGIKLIGPAGSATISGGVILAKRHIHFSTAEAKDFKVADGAEVRVRCGVGGERETVFEKVLCRVHDNFKLELHLDVEEANAALAKNGDSAYIV